jgi:hypothetical protein
MSQTTGQTSGQTSNGRGRGGARAARPGRSSGPARPSVPAPPRRRRPALTALAVLLIVGGAALAGLLAVRLDSREPVLVVSQQISTGEKVTGAMLAYKNVSGDGLDVITRDQAKDIVGKFYARQTLYKGQLLSVSQLRKNPPLEQDQAQVGVPLNSGKFPPDLRSGDAVRLTRIGDASNPSTALCTGLVLEVKQAKSGGFGSDAKASVAEILIPQSVTDLVVGATGTDDLGIAIIDRGVSLGDQDIEALAPGRS